MTGSTVADGYVLLEQDHRKMLGGQFVTRPQEVAVKSGPVQLGLDAYGLRHLLIPMDRPEDVREDRRSGGVLLVRETLQIDDEEVAFADLVCQVPELAPVFERLVDDVLTRIDKDPDQPLSAVQAALEEWRRLLLGTPRGLGREAGVGLVGELAVLEQLAARDPANALDAWRGPTGAVHDFVSGGRAIEVKSTASVDGNFVEISNLDQLDPADLAELQLLVVHLRANDASPSIDDRLDHLIQMGVPKPVLIDRVAAVGHTYGAEGVDPHRYSVRSIRVWHVDSQFPGLRRSALTEQHLRGIGRVRYELAVDSAPRPLDDDDVSDRLARWVMSS